MTERLSTTNPSALDVHTVLSAALLRQGTYTAAAHRTLLTTGTAEQTVSYRLHDHFAWESTIYPAHPPIPHQQAHMRLLEQGSTILYLTAHKGVQRDDQPSYTICRPSQVNPELAIGGLFYETDNIPAALPPPTDPTKLTIVASNEQTDSHRYVTNVGQEPTLLAIYNHALIQQPRFRARKQPTYRGTLSLQEQYATLPILGDEPSVRLALDRGRPEAFRADTKSIFRRDFSFADHIDHLTVLSKLGLHIPSFRYQVGRRAIFAAVDYIEPAYSSRQEALEQPLAVAKAAKLPGIISLYQQWSLQQEQSWTFDDIHNVHQYTYGINHAESGAQQPQWWLTDIGSTTTNQRRWLDQSIDSFHAEITQAQQQLLQRPGLFT